MKFSDRLRVTTTVIDTSVLTLGGPTSKSFWPLAKVIAASGAAIGDTVSLLVDDEAGNWEIGTYTITNNFTLARTAVTASSNGGAAVAFLAGSKTVTAASADSNASGGAAIKNSANSVLLVADSMGERSFAQSSSTGVVDNGDGTATMTFASSPFVQSIQTAVGDTIRVNNAAAPKLNQLAATVTAVDTTAKTVTYTTTGPYSPLIAGPNPFIVLERSMTPLAFFPYLNQLAGGELTVTSNCSQGGASLSEVGSIFDAISQPARFGIFLLGRNNIYRTPGQTYAQVIAEAKPLLDKFVRKCDIPVVITTPPQDSVALGTAWTLAKMQYQLQYETWLKQYARSIGCIVVDAAAASSNGVGYRDPVSSNANPPTGFSPDGTHQAGLSAYALGKAVYSAIKQYIVPTMTWPGGVAHVYANDPSIITDNAVLAGTTGTFSNAAGATVSGTVPTGMVVTPNSAGVTVALSTIARTVAADGDAIGNNLRAVISTTGAAQVTFQVALTVARLSAGDVVRALARFALSSSSTPGSGSPVNVIGLNCQARVVTANAAIIAADACSGSAPAPQSLTEGMAGALVTPWMKLRDSSQGAITSGYINVSIYFGGAGSATLDLAHMHLRKLLA